jgi:hypothetical protein
MPCGAFPCIKILFYSFVFQILRAEEKEIDPTSILFEKRVQKIMILMN